jgi:ATP-binding cassette subfamily F protein 3
MDGIALRAADAVAIPARLRVAGSAEAGHPFPHEVPDGCAVRVMTGAPLPKGCDSVQPIELTPDAGECSVQPGTRIARIEQEAPALERWALDYLLDADTLLRDAESAIAAGERDGDGHRIAEAHERYAQAGGYTAQARAAAILAGLGFASGDGTRPVHEFSGGYRMRLNLGRALIRPSDLMLLDEPTNHLDLDAILWLENWLRGYPGTLLVVSHDRDFLDRATGHTLAIQPHDDAGVVRLFTGNYSQYESQRALELEQQQAAAVKQEREIERIHSFVSRFRA